MPRAKKVRGKGVRRVSRRGKGVWSGVKRRGKNLYKATAALVASRAAPLARLSRKRGKGVWSKVKRAAKYALPAAALALVARKGYRLNKAINNAKDVPMSVLNPYYSYPAFNGTTK